MNRRVFISALGGAAAVWPLAARAQQQLSKLPLIGFLAPNTPSIDAPRVGAFTQRLHELGWTEGRNVVLEFRWAAGENKRAVEIISDFVRTKVDVIVTSGTPLTLAARQATSVIPIVFAAVGDPIGTGLVASLARPGANITGLSLQQSDIASKRIELVLEVVPQLRRLAIMANSRNPSAVLEMRDAQTAARAVGIDVIPLEIERAEDIMAALSALNGSAGALYVCNDPLVATNRVRISILALGERLPTMHGAQEYVEVGGLISYAPSFVDLFRRSAQLVDKILRGAKPGDLPVEQPTRFDLAFNLITAKALRMEVPATLLARADEVIE